jgi:hypothetical protein
VAAGLGPSLGRVAKKGEKKNKKKTRFGEFGRNSNEFEKCKVLVQKVVMIVSEIFLSG